MGKKTTVRTPVEKYNGPILGVMFENGVGKTDDDVALAYFRRRGYTVEDESQDEEPPAKPDDTWTVDALTAYAKEHEIALEGASKKADILAKIEAHDLLA